MQCHYVPCAIHSTELDDFTDENNNVEERPTLDQKTAESSEDVGPALESVEVVEPSIETSVCSAQLQTPDEQRSDTSTEKEGQCISKWQINLSM